AFRSRPSQLGPVRWARQRSWTRNHRFAIALVLALAGGVRPGAPEQDRRGAHAAAAPGPGLVAAKPGGASRPVAQSALLGRGSRRGFDLPVVPVSSGDRLRHRADGQLLGPVGGSRMGSLVLSLQGGAAVRSKHNLSAMGD